MKVYFVSSVSAVLKLDGEYVGVIDHFLRFVEIERGKKVFVEVVPDNTFQSINFFFREGIVGGEPDFCDVYLLKEDFCLEFNNFQRKDMSFKLIGQRKFCGNLVTLFALGEAYIGVDGVEYTLQKLDKSFFEAYFDEVTVAGFPLLKVHGGENVVLIGESGKIVFSNRCKILSVGDKLSVEIDFESCTNSYARCSFSYDGSEMKLVESRTIEREGADETLLPFALFESVLSRGDYKKYLSDDLRGQAKNLPEFLGEFVSVIPPLAGSQKNTVGLVYHQSRHLYTVKYFTVEISCGKVTNVVEE
jgi:hypothetical protein